MDKETSLAYPDTLPAALETDNDKIIEQIIEMVKKYAPNSNTDVIYIAYKLAKAAHKGQYRKSGAPYIDHPVQIAYIAAELEMDVIGIAAALMHDVIEDTPYTFNDIKSFYFCISFFTPYIFLRMNAKNLGLSISTTFIITS